MKDQEYFQPLLVKPKLFFLIKIVNNKIENNIDGILMISANPYIY